MPNPKDQIQTILNDLPDAALQKLLAALQGALSTAATTQFNLGQAKGYQVTVQGGTAYIGDQLNVDAVTLEAVLNKLITERQQPQISGIPHNLPRSGAVKFVGRETDFTNLHTQLHQADRIAITALRGMGGIGKTELALKYALYHRDQGTYPGGICWLQARDQDVASQIVRFAKTVGVSTPEGELADKVAYVWAQWPLAPSAMLVIYDDVADFANIQPYLPPQTEQFRVLLTTRQRFSGIDSLEIDVLSPDAALD